MSERDALALAAVLEAQSPGLTDQEVAAELRRLHHNEQVLKNALWRACGDDREIVNDYIASEGGLK